MRDETGGPPNPVSPAPAHPPAGGFGGGASAPAMGFEPKEGESGARTALAIVAVIGGVLALVVVMLAVLGYYGVRRRSSLAKQAEARHSLGVMAKGAVSAFE